MEPGDYTNLKLTSDFNDYFNDIFNDKYPSLFDDEQPSIMQNNLTN
jgi:hypothetical protein